MAEVTIKRCTLRIVRRGGWSWGPHPRELLQGAVRALPSLISRKLGELAIDEDREISSPVRIRIPVRLSELIAARKDWGEADSLKPGAASEALRVRLDAALDSALKQAGIAGPSASLRSEEPEPASAAHEETPSSPEKSGALLRILKLWRKQGVLASRLDQFSIADLESWHRALLERAVSRDARFIAHEELELALLRILQRFGDAPVGRRVSLQLRVIAIAELAEELGAAAISARLEAILDLHLPCEPMPASEPKEKLEGPAEFVSSIQPAEDPCEAEAPLVPSRKLVPRATVQSRIAISAEIAISSALPFLLLPALSRTGYLAVLAATLEAERLSEEAPLFATALAYKVLDPPRRGWRRGETAELAAAAFAGRIEPVPEPALVDFARKLSEHLSPLDAAVSGPLIDGHDPSQPLLLKRVDEASEPCYVLFDSEGVFPIASSPSPATLIQVLVRPKRSIVLVPAANATAELLKQLDAAGMLFITNAPPARKEHWRAVRLAESERCWTNDASTPAPFLARAAGRLREMDDEAVALWQALRADRPSVPLAASDAFDRCLTLTAALALGTLSWNLWREREASTPLLALVRFANLDARVRFDSRSVRVRLPLGRRFQDLLDHGLLDDITDVPWLGGRVLQFSGG